MYQCNLINKLIVNFLIINLPNSENSVILISDKKF